MDEILRNYLRGFERQVATMQVMMAAGFQRMGKHMTQIDDEIGSLTADVAALTTVVSSAELALNGIAALVANGIAAALAAGANPEELKALSDVHSALVAQTSGLAAAVAAATPPVATPTAATPPVDTAPAAA